MDGEVRGSKAAITAVVMLAALMAMIDITIDAEFPPAFTLTSGGCGAPAAEKYCESKGWSKARRYVVAHNIGASTPTRLIGTGAVCDQNFCDGFEFIRCSN